MSEKSEVERLLRRHEAFWRMEEVDRPLLNIIHHTPVEELHFPYPDGHITAEMLDPEESLRFLGDDWGVPWGDTMVLGDVFRVGRPDRRVAWLEAIIGCPVYASSSSGTIWGEPYLDDWAKMETTRFSPDNEWLQRLLESIRILVKDSNGQYLVVPTNNLGASDRAATLLGDEQLCLALYDHPIELKRLLSLCTDLSIEVARAELASIPRFHGGYCTKSGIWTPGTTILTQEDHSVLFSLSHFREFILPHQMRTIEAFDYTVIHLHSIGLRVVDDLLSLDKLAGIQVLVDPSGPSVEELIPDLAKIQERKPLMVEGEFTEEEVELLLSNLSPRGLFVGARRALKCLPSSGNL